MHLLGNTTLAGFILASSWTLSQPVAAEETRAWEQTHREEFEKGTAERVTIRSDGKLMLAPRFREIYEAPASYLWALTTDSAGNFFVGGGPGARVFRVTPDGRKSMLFESEDVEIHALAVDRNNNVYAATSPDSRVYKIDPSGGFSVFFDPDVAYIWGMAFDSKGDLYLATGDQGGIYRVTPSGEGSLYFDTEETHVRAILVDSNDRLIAGTDPGALILRISPSENGEPRGFVLYQSSKKEITALALGRDQSVYAAGVGTRGTTTAAGPAPGPTVTVTTAAPSAMSGPLTPGNPQPQEQRPTLQLPAPAPSVTARVVGGSEVYRIFPDGEPRTVWRSSTDIAYALALDPSDRLLIGTGDRGRLFRVESETLYSLVLTTPSSQITAFTPAQDGKLLAATSNVGKIYELGPGNEKEGQFESEVFDAELFSQWGRLEWRGETPEGSEIAVSTRSGNLNHPARHWSGWSEPIRAPEGGTCESPASRFFQWRAVFSSGETKSPVLDSVTVYYLPVNVAPVISEIEATPPNYDFVQTSATASSSNLTLPPLGRAAPARRVTVKTPKPGGTMKPAKGYVGVRWLAEDENDDDLIFKVEIRGEGEQEWKLLAEEVEDNYLSWDSTSFADGLYSVRVTASDSPSNPASEAKSHTKISGPFIIDNTAPAIDGPHVVAEDRRPRVRFKAADTVTKIQNAEYSLDGGDWRPILPASRLFDSRELSFEFQTDPVDAGEHTIAVRVYDEHDNVAVAKAVIR